MKLIQCNVSYLNFKKRKPKGVLNAEDKNHRSHHYLLIPKQKDYRLNMAHYSIYQRVKRALEFFFFPDLKKIKKGTYELAVNWRKNFVFRVYTFKIKPLDSYILFFVSLSYRNKSSQCTKM